VANSFFYFGILLVVVIGLLKIALNVSSHICWKWCKMAIRIYILPILYMWCVHGFLELPEGVQVKKAMG